MRIAFVPAARLLSDTTANGEGLIATDLLRRLAARGHRIVAWCERAELSKPIDGVEVREVPVAGRTVAHGRLAFARRIAEEASRERFDVAHALFPFNTDDGYALVRGAPLVVGPLNLPWPGSELRSANPLARAARTWTARAECRLHASTIERASRVMVTGASAFLAMPPEAQEKAVEIPFGIDVSRFEAAALPSEPTIVFLSVLSKRKGVAVLVRAMERVRERVPGARLVVAGADPDGMRPSLERLASTIGAGDAVEFVGAVAPENVGATYARARVFCQPSFGEPFGMTVIEAMACGRPVVGTLGGGIADAVVQGRGGLLVPQGDHNALAGALCEVLTEPGKATAMGAFNRARAERQYDIERVVDRIEQTYASLLNGSTHAEEVRARVS